MLLKIEARILIFPGTDFHFPSTSMPPGTFLRLCPTLYKQIRVTLKKTRVLFSEALYIETVDLENFATTRWSSQHVVSFA